jgi:hypothetical protein
MEKMFIALCSVCAALFAASCAPSTPATRISESPLAFEKLRDEHQELVQRGEIAKGMDMTAVALAWGEPSIRVEGFKGTRKTERWEYNGSRPVMTNTAFAGSGHGFYGPYRYSVFGTSLGPQVVYVPYRRSAVWFVGGKVDEWERLR